MANIITDTKRLGQLIRIIGQRGPQWADMVQTAAVSATIIARQHGQIGPINSLLKAMAGAPANTHKLLTAWLYRTPRLPRCRLPCAKTMRQCNAVILQVQQAKCPEGCRMDPRC